MNKTGKVHFSITGEGYVSIIRDLFDSNEYWAVYEMLSTDLGKNLTEDITKGLCLTGYTASGVDEMTLEKEEPIDVTDRLYCIHSFWEKDYDDIRRCELTPEDIRNDKVEQYSRVMKNIVGLKSLFAKPSSLIRDFVIEEFLNSVNLNYDEIERCPSGTILRDGTILQCDIQGHNDLYKILVMIDEASSRDSFKDKYNVKFSNGAYNGDKSWILRNRFKNTESITKLQKQSIFDLRKYVNTFYGGKANMMTLLMEVDSEKYGTKYSNLKFLEKYYEVKIPKIKKFDKDNFTGKKIILRTSPTNSLPGVLNSIVCKDDLQKVNIYNDIMNDFEQYKNVISGNKLYVFEQEFIEGINGVCNINLDRKSLEKFTYAASEKQGDIVKGKAGDVFIDKKHFFALENLLEELAKDFNKAIQVEFVISEDELYIVQFRLLKNRSSFSSVVHDYVSDEKRDAFKIKSFSEGNRWREIKPIDIVKILIIDDDCDVSQMFLNTSYQKQAVIVRKAPVFSHILALSLALHIPSVYDVGDIDFTKYSSIKFYTEDKEGWLLCYFPTR